MTALSMNPSLRTTVLLLAVILCIGSALRIYPSQLFKHLGFDEKLYADYVDEIADVGILRYPQIAGHYLIRQKALPSAILPPTRFSYIFCSHLWKTLTQTDSLHSIRATSCLFSILAVALATAFAWRLAGQLSALVTSAFMAVAPVEIHMAQHGLIDGFFAFWALATIWLLWENLQRPNHRWLLFGYTLLLAVLVLTKENSFFVYLGIWLLLLANWKVGFGTATRSLYLCTLLGAALGGGTLMVLAGGMDTFFEIYLLLTRKAYQLPFAMLYCDGPWQRLIVDSLLVSPVITLLAFGTVLNPRALTKPVLFLTLFLVSTYTIITSVKYGLNLRYGVMWDMPIRFLATTTLLHCQKEWKVKWPWLLAFILGICFLEIRQYDILFIQHETYELISIQLLKVLNFVKK